MSSLRSVQIRCFSVVNKKREINAMILQSEGNTLKRYTEKIEYVRNFLNNFDQRVSCCKGKPAETRLECLKAVLK